MQTPLCLCLGLAFPGRQWERALPSGTRRDRGAWSLTDSLHRLRAAFAAKQCAFAQPRPVGRMGASPLCLHSQTWLGFPVIPQRRQPSSGTQTFLKAPPASQASPRPPDPETSSALPGWLVCLFVWRQGSLVLHLSF